jgi:hypothetical protein
VDHGESVGGVGRLAGGFLSAAGRFVTDPLEQAVRLGASEVDFVHLATAPVVGAVLWAIEGAGGSAGGEVRARLSDAVREAATRA